MTLTLLPALAALFIWWFSTGAILFLDGRSSRTFPWSMAAATLMMAAALYGTGAGSADTSVAGAYLGFVYGLVTWGWLELGYYMGFIVGPRRRRPAESRGWRRFFQAVEATLYHEVGALALTMLIAALTWDAPNRMALWTFLILWGMQVSAKVNVFLGVPNLSESFLPEHLAFLRAYMTRKPMNLFFPLSVTASVVVTTLLVLAAAAEGRTDAETVGLTILASLMGLAVLEHWFLVVPLPADWLWRWSLKGRAEPLPSAGAPETFAPTDPTEAARPLRRAISLRGAASGLTRAATPLASRRSS